jgi:4-amino-4-deoxy-L-arabinose transferase-like glycosyltransferase
MNGNLSASHEEQRLYILLFGIFVLSLVLRLWLLDKRWINPDEGAHMMDAVLLLNGKIPAVDYDSRQPFYVYAIAGTLKVFGIDYASGRILPLICSMLTGMMVFLIAQTLFGPGPALLSAVVYWMFPLELFNSVMVKTQPLASLLTGSSIYMSILSWKRRRELWLAPAGVFAGLCFYVRESALVIPLTVLVFIALVHAGQTLRIAKSAALFLLGYVGVFALSFTYYSRYMSLSDFLTGALSPLGILTWAWGKLTSLTAIASEHAQAQTPQTFFGSEEIYYHYLKQATTLHLFLLVGFAFSIFALIFHAWSNRNSKAARDYLLSCSVLVIWVISLFCAYGFFFFSRGFFVDYSREFLPPLAIIFSVLLYRTIPTLAEEGMLERFILGGLCVSATLFLAQSYHRDSFGMGHHASLAIAFLALFTFTGQIQSYTRRFFIVFAMSVIIILIPVARMEPWKSYMSGVWPSFGTVILIYALAWMSLEKKEKGKWKTYGAFIGRSVLVSSFVVSVTYAATILTPYYEAVWSPMVLKEISSYLKTNTCEDDVVISGAVIWEFQARRKLFGNISHPLAFEYNISKEETEHILLTAAANPPEVIILDGYTEKTYLRHVPSLAKLLQEKYLLSKSIEPSDYSIKPAAYPVSVYRLKRIDDRIETPQPVNLKSECPKTDSVPTATSVKDSPG